MTTLPVTVNNGREKGYASLESTSTAHPATVNRGLERGYATLEPTSTAHPATINRGLEKGYATRVPAVFLTAQNPAPNEINVSPDALIGLRIDDLTATVSLATVTIQVDRGSGFATAYTSSAFQAGFQGASSSVTAYPPNGYTFVIDSETAFTENYWVQVRVQASDTYSPPESLDETYQFLVRDSTPPVVTDRDPAPGDTDVPRDSNIEFRVTDAGSTVVLATLNVWVQQAGLPWANAVINGVFQSGYNGPGSSATPVVGGYDIFIDPTSLLVEGGLVQVRIRAEDTYANYVDVTYSFNTSVPGVDKGYAQSDGGEIVTFTGMSGGTYQVHFGPNGDETDPLCASIVGGEGQDVVFTGGIASVGLPPTAPGGPYDFYLVRVRGEGPATLTLAGAVTITKYDFRDGAFRMRRLLPPWWYVGQRQLDTEDEQ